MSPRLHASLLVALLLLPASAGLARAEDSYVLDAMHSGVGFRISHLGLSWCLGRFNDVGGKFTIDADDPSKCSFELEIKTESVDTNNSRRDGHLRSPDFLNTKQYPLMTFKSTAVKPAQNGYEVTGDLTLHGVTQPVRLVLNGGRKAEFPRGTQRTGYSCEVVLKRSKYGMEKMLEAIGDDVYITISFEGVKK